MFTRPNLLVKASRSGKMDKNLTKEYFSELFFGETEFDSLLLVKDSWTGQTNETISTTVPNDVEFNTITVPPKCTRFIQPLDVFFNHFWKSFVRKVWDRVLLDDISVHMFDRDSILRLQSLVHLQFSSPRYVNFIRYSWFLSGYSSAEPPVFYSPTEFSFSSEFFDEGCSVCDSSQLLRCGWCKSMLCFDHFFTDFHDCDNYVE
jgi:Tc5 transposase C-terminal domain